MREVIEHIEKYYGKIANEIEISKGFGKDIKITIINPTEDQPFYTLITVGLSDYKMDVPDEYDMLNLEFAEVLISLPDYWDIYNKAEMWQWPINLLKSIVNLAVSRGGFISWGQTIDNLVPFSKTYTEQSAVILVEPQMIDDEGLELILPDREINFYQIIPIYIEELEYKEAYGSEELINIMGNVSFIVNPFRYSSVGEMAGENIIDDVIWHTSNIKRKNIDTEPYNALNHMAIYLRWAMKNDLLSDEGWKKFEDYIEVNKDNLHMFIYEKLKGILSLKLFNEKGAAFTKYYYVDADEPYYPMDIDNYAYEYFGEEMYNSEKFKNEAYLFVPLSETYYENMKKVLDKRFEYWQKEIYK